MEKPDKNINYKLSDLEGKIEAIMAHLESTKLTSLHDIRAKLNNIGLYCQLMIQDHGSSLDNALKKSIMDLNDEVDSMEELIDFLAVSLSGPRKELVTCAVQLKKLTEELISSLQ